LILSKNKMNSCIYFFVKKGNVFKIAALFTSFFHVLKHLYEANSIEM